MNRFEQKSMSLGRKLIYLLPILAFVILFVLFLRGIGSVGESTLSKQQESLETALERSISQCYAVEGCYPPSLEYLEQHYGLLYDEDSFFIDYEYYGSNLLPEVTVLRRNHQKQEKHFIVDILFVLALFGVFAVSALALVTIGADVYQHTVEDMGVNYESRTAVSYIMEKVRQNDTADSIFLTDLENVPALCMLSEIDEETYCTYLYLYDGHLKELFMREGASLGGQVLPAGTDIMDLQEFSLSYASDDLIRISLRTASGEDHTFYIHVHCNTTTE